MFFREFIAQQWARYERLKDREQTLMIITLVVIGFVCFVWLIWDPIHERMNKEQQRFHDEIALQTELRSLRPPKVNPAVSANTDQSLLAVVNDSTASKGINLKRVEPREDSSLRIWIDNVKFNDLMLWIQSLQINHAVIVDNISMDRGAASGRVNAVMVLTR